MFFTFIIRNDYYIMQFSEFFKKYEGKDIIVLGCGSSVTDFVPKIPEGVVTIGVNDIGDIFTPEFLLVVNSPNTFKPVSRVSTISNNKSKYFISHFPEKWIPLGIKNEIVNIKLGDRNFSNLGKSATDIIDYSNNSPFMACICAYYLGAKRIGLIGVDFTDNHFNNKDGRHKLTGQLKEIDKKFGILNKKLSKLGCEIYNLSPESLLQSLPKMDQDEFIKNINK